MVNIPIVMNLYCVMCSEVTNNIWVNDFCVNGKIGLIFIVMASFRKKEGDSLRGIKYLLKKHKEIKLVYFLKRYLEEGLSEDELNKMTYIDIKRDQNAEKSSVM